MCFAQVPSWIDLCAFGGAASHSISAWSLLANAFSLVSSYFRRSLHASGRRNAEFFFFISFKTLLYGREGRVQVQSRSCRFIIGG